MLIHPKEVRVWFYSAICTFSIHTNNLIHSLQNFLSKWLTEETKNLMAALNKHRFAKLHRSRRALAIPATFLILFISMLSIISITYYFAIEKVNTRSTTLKIATAKQDMLSFDETLLAVLWQLGSETIGQVMYELPYSETPDTGLFLKGDSRTITNQSGSVVTQLSIRSGAQHPEILLRYRPTVSYTTAGVESDKAVNNVRIYVVNLNSSETIALFGKVPLKISCVATQITTTTYDLSYEPETLLFTSILEGVSGQVSVPISSTASGAIINVEIVLCNITIQRWVR